MTTRYLEGKPSSLSLLAAIGKYPALLDRLIRGLSRETPAPEERDRVIKIA